VLGFGLKVKPMLERLTQQQTLGEVVEEAELSHLQHTRL